MTDPQKVDDFINLCYGRDEVLQRVRTNCAINGLPDIAVSDQQASLLTLLVQITGAERILEIGTLGGLSTIALARPAQAYVDTLEFDPHHCSVAEDNIHQAGLAHKVTVYEGPAITSIMLLAQELKQGLRDTYDFVFIDADKENNLFYFNNVLPLVRPGGVIMVDNVIREGRCLTRRDKTEFLQDVAMDQFTDSCVVQTVGDKVWDGFVLARVK